MHSKAGIIKPPNQKENKSLSVDEIEGKRQGWEIQNLSDEASQKDEDEIQRQTLRGDESKGNPDDRDHAGSAEKRETPQGREEAKNDTKGKANRNG